MQKAMKDRLMDMCDRNAEQMAELWYKALSTNPKTTTCHLMSREGCLRHATEFYKNLDKMFFAEDCYQAVAHILDIDGFAEDFYSRRIPLEEVIYALILLRRYIWVFAESQAVYNYETTDMYDALNSINRILLIFDYAAYIVTRKYQEFTGKLK